MSKKSQQVQSIVGSAKVESFVIERPQRARLAFEIAGRTPLLQNRFPPKVIEEMLKKHMGLTVQREKKNPRQVIENAIIRNMAGAVAIPPVAVKLAMLTAASSLKTFARAKTQLKTSLFIVGESLPIQYKAMLPQMDAVSLGDMKRTRDIRFRPAFHDWSLRLIIQYSESLLQPQSVADLLQRSGDVGVGEWRPERSGSYGTYRIARALTDTDEIAEVEAACNVPLERPEIPKWALDSEIDMELLAKLFNRVGQPSADDEQPDPDPDPEPVASQAT